MAYIWDATPYITSKFAAYGYSEALARSLRPLGIGVSVLCPGLVATNLGETARYSGVPDEHAGGSVIFPARGMQVASSLTAVGRMVCDAVRDDRFAIFTHPGDLERFRTWRLDIDASLADAIAGSPDSRRASSDARETVSSVARDTGASARAGHSRDRGADAP